MTNFFERLLDELFWRYRFNDRWENVASEYFLRPRYEHKELLQRAKLRWREELGRPYGSEMAVFLAFKEFCNTYYAAHETQQEIIPSIEMLAQRLRLLAPFYDRQGNSVDQKQLLGPFWSLSAEDRSALIK